MPKSIYKSCKEIDKVYASISQEWYYTHYVGIKNMRDMLAHLSDDSKFLDGMKREYSDPWRQLVDAIREILGLKPIFSDYDILKKAIDEIVAHPDYQIAIGYFNHTKTYYLEEFQSCDTGLVPL